MSLRLVLTVNAVVAGLFALSFIAAPGPTLEMYGNANVSDEALTMSRWFGSAIVGYVVLSWLARELPSSDARRALLAGLVTSWGASLLMALYVVLTGRVNALGWSSVVLSLVFMGLIGMHMRRSPEPVTAAT